MTNNDNEKYERDLENLIKSMENEGNVPMMELNSFIIMEHKNNILQKLNLERKQLKTFHKKLKKYRYCSDLSDLQFGNFIGGYRLKIQKKLI